VGDISPLFLHRDDEACHDAGVFISSVDAGLERLLRERLPLPEDVGDISFDPPAGSWSAQLSRITVNLFLYDVQRSTQPSRAPVHKPVADGRDLRRHFQPMAQLGYLVSAWAGSPRDEHQLLGDVFSVLAGVDSIPEELIEGELSSSAQVSLGDDRSLVREIWSATGGSLKASFTMKVSVATDTYVWEEQAPPVDRIAGMARRM
jgi:hypothetical protein